VLCCRLAVTLPEVVYDLPGKVKAKRLMQKAVGYCHTIVSVRKTHSISCDAIVYY
jgi:hypothetical protein